MYFDLLIFFYRAWLLTRRQDFKSASLAVASKAMRNELNQMIDGVEDPAAKRVCIYLRMAYPAGI